MVIELEQAISRAKLKGRFAEYSAEQPLFADCKGLWAFVRQRQGGGGVRDLIDSKAFGPSGIPGVLAFGGRFVRIEPELHPTILDWAEQTFKAPCFVRVDPTRTYSTPPRPLLLEEIMVPADPKWWKHLDLHRSKQTACKYALPEPSTPNPLGPFWDYHVKKIRYLEAGAGRKGNDNLSMMVEELAVSREDDGLVLGRCIHLDSDDPRGTPFNEAKVNHIDLAMNVYVEAAASLRLESILKDKVDATFRTHLLRLEGVPFTALLDVARLFFVSKTLLAEWLDNQFGTTVEDPVPVPDGAKR